MQDWFYVQSASYGCYYISVEINGYDTYRISLSYYHEESNMVDHPTDKTTTSNKAYAKKTYKKFKEYAEDDRYGWNYNNAPTWEYTKNTVLPSVSKYYFPESLSNSAIKLHLSEDINSYSYTGLGFAYDDSLEQEKREQEIDEFIKHNGYYLDEELFEEILWYSQDDAAFKLINQWVLRQEEDPTFIDRIYEEGAKEFEEKIWNPVMATEKDAEILDDELEPVPNDYIQISGPDYDCFMDYREFEKNYVKRKDELIRKQIDTALELTKNLTKEY